MHVHHILVACVQINSSPRKVAEDSEESLSYIASYIANDNSHAQLFPNWNSDL